ncbi:MAG: hypothetical protein Q8R02_11675 [Hyphomonadaceae bacterium]|nr:hypothetical protein [Hyphomonadaceae bacterium]
MRKVVSEAWLRDEIAAHMSDPVWDSKSFAARPVRCRREGDGPNWRYSFNPAAVPKGFAERWKKVWPKFEVFDMADDQPGW